MKLNNKGIKLMHDFEGCKLTAYECPKSLMLSKDKKFYTIGFGNTFYEDGSKVQPNQHISEKRANQLFENIVNKNFNIKPILKVELNENQFSALVSFAYNVGMANLGKSTLLKKVNKDPNDPTIKVEFLKWNKAGGKVLKGLTARREAEAKLYYEKN